MAYEFDPVEYGQVLAEIGRLKEDVREQKLTTIEIVKRIEDLEHKARQNEIEHIDFVKSEAIRDIQNSLKKMENNIQIMTPTQAKESGVAWYALILKNPTYVLWIMLGGIVLLMIFMGYSFAEISQVLEKLK